MHHATDDATELGAHSWHCNNLVTANPFDRAANPALHRAWAEGWGSAVEVPGAVRDEVEPA